MNTKITKMKNFFNRYALSAFVLTAFYALMVGTGVMPVFAAGGNAALEGVMEVVMDVIGNAAFYIGLVIVLWGVFQIVLAFRREDSEAIGKQITTVVVGGVLVGFPTLMDTLLGAMR